MTPEEQAIIDTLKKQNTEAFNNTRTEQKKAEIVKDANQKKQEEKLDTILEIEAADVVAENIAETQQLEEAVEQETLEDEVLEEEEAEETEETERDAVVAIEEVAEVRPSSPGVEKKLDEHPEAKEDAKRLEADDKRKEQEAAKSSEKRPDSVPRPGS